MRIPDFIFSFIDAFTPMKDSDKTELMQDANVDYYQIRDEMFDKNRQLKEKQPEVLTWKHKIVKYSEYWPCRAGLAILYILLLPMVQDYLHPKKDLNDELDD